MDFQISNHGLHNYRHLLTEVGEEGNQVEDTSVLPAANLVGHHQHEQCVAHGPTQMEVDEEVRQSPKHVLAYEGIGQEIDRPRDDEDDVKTHQPQATEKQWTTSVGLAEPTVRASKQDNKTTRHGVVVYLGCTILYRMALKCNLILHTLYKAKACLILYE